MPFLNQDILLELLNTYTGEDLTEDKSYTNSKFKKWFTSAIDVGKSMIGINTNSKTWYFKLRGHIIRGTQDSDPNAWGDLIIDAGKAGFQTHTDSIIGSKLCRSALALRSFVLNQVTTMLASIPYQRILILGENEECPPELNSTTLLLQKKGKNVTLYWSYNDKVINHSLKLSDVKELVKKIYSNKDLKEFQEPELIYELLFKFFLSQNGIQNNLLPEQIQALQIRDVINQKIEEQKSFIEDANKNIERNKHKPNLEFDKLETNEDILKYKKNSEENIKIRQRNLCYLNAYSYLKLKKYQVSTPDPQPKALKELIRELFPKFKFYNFSSTELNDDTTKKMDSDLPLFLQPNYDSIYLRSKETDPRKQKHSDERIVNRFQEEALKNTISINKNKKLEESKSEFSITKTPSMDHTQKPMSTPIPSGFSQDEHEDSDFELEDKYEEPSKKLESKKNSPSVQPLTYKNIFKNLPNLDFTNELPDAHFNNNQSLIQIDDTEYFKAALPQSAEESPKLNH